MTRFRPALLFALALVLALPAVASAQSAASVVERMKANYEQQMTADTYIVKTNLYTSYSRKVTRNGQATYETATQLGEGEALPAVQQTPGFMGQQESLDELAEHATYAGTESIDGIACHVLVVDNPAAMDAEMGAEARKLTFYINADTHYPTRMEAVVDNPNGDEPITSIMDFRDYRTTEGLTLPFRMEMTTNMMESMSPEQRRQMEQLKQQLENMPESQRKRMEQMMGNRMKQLESMMDGSMTVTVEEVQVNVPIPDGVFDDSSTG